MLYSSVSLFRQLRAIVYVSVFFVSTAHAFDHQQWDTLLKKYVVVYEGGKSSAVNYTAMQGDIKKIQTYLKRLSLVSKVEFYKWPESEQLSFLINTYNAATLELVLRDYPVDSIKELGSLFFSPWGKDFIYLFGELRSLDDVEHHLIRKNNRYHEPRVHFALNCASIGCPALLDEAYTAEKLERQLERQTVLFLSDETRNRFFDKHLSVSSIFKWYREDFEFNWRSSHSLEHFFMRYAQALDLSDAQVAEIAAGKIEIIFSDYDWQLNDEK